MESAVDSTTLSRIPPLSEEATFSSFLSYSRTISGQLQLFSRELKLMSRGDSWARGQFTLRSSRGSRLEPASPKANVCGSRRARGFQRRLSGVCRPGRALVKADKRKHLLTCHYEGSARPGLSHVPRNAWLLPAQREEKKKAEKRQGFFLFASSQVDLIDGPPDFIAIFELLEMPPSCVCVSTHTHPFARTAPARVPPSFPAPGRIPQLFQLSAEGELERVCVG